MATITRWPNAPRLGAGPVFAAEQADGSSQATAAMGASKDGIQKSDNRSLLSLDGIIASRGGIPLIEDDKLIGAIGCAGATGSQDKVACTAGAATIGK